MGRIHVLPDHVANKIAAGEVVERPASVVKELLENALDAGARRIRVQVEAGGKKLIQVTDDGCGMSHDDALLAFERHATSKIKDADDLLNIATLGFRGEALPSIAAVSRLTLETAANSESAGARIEIAGGKMLRVEEAGLPAGTAITVRDLFFNVPARKKFLKAEATELSHIASLVTHYALAHPEMHFELHSSTNALLVAPPVEEARQRLFQIFGKEMLNDLLPVAASSQLERAGLPEPPPWKRGPDYAPAEPGELRLHGFVSKPEVQKLNRNSIFVFVNRRLIRDRLLQHAITEAYRNILPGGVFPAVLLFVEMPGSEVDVNVHPSKTEVRFRQQSQVHDFVRDSVRAALVKSRPVPGFLQEISAQPLASPAFTPPTPSAVQSGAGAEFALRTQELPPRNQSLDFQASQAITVEGNAAVALAPSVGIPVVPIAPSVASASVARGSAGNGAHCGGAVAFDEEPDAPSLAGLKPLGQVRNSFILAVDGSGLWIIDQHVAHERILFERVLRQANSKDGHVQGQRLLMPLIVELTPAQQVVFAEIRDELARNGFEMEPFGARTVAIKTAPAGVEATSVEHLLHELLENCAPESQAITLESLRTRIAASIACHAAIKVNMPLEQQKMEWLLAELANTECPMSCPHGRPVVLRYSLRDIQRAFKRT